MTKVYVELNVFQGYIILTLHILLNQSGILRGETILLDHDVHVCEPIYIYDVGMYVVVDIWYKG